MLWNNWKGPRKSPWLAKDWTRPTREGKHDIEMDAGEGDESLVISHTRPPISVSKEDKDQKTTTCTCSVSYQVGKNYESKQLDSLCDNIEN